MTPSQTKRINDLLAVIGQMSPTEPVSAWAEGNLCFNEPKISGPFSLGGRQYMREPIDNWNNPRITDQILCFATRAGKTRILFAGAAWRIMHNPMRCLWTKPATHGPGGARNDSKTKFVPMVRATAGLRDFIPTGAGRHDFSNLQQMIHGSIIDWVGTGSAKQLSSNPCDVTIQDEIDGYTERGDSEAHPCILIDERTKDSSMPFRIKASTPTLETGQIWQWMMKSDLRRRFLPCPHCGKFFTLAWSEQFSVLPAKDAAGQPIPTGYVQWDKEARREDGDWDLARVVASTRIECPHCQGHCRDDHKVAMDARGEWRPTRNGSPGCVGYHLSSLYVTHRETQWSQLALKFLLAKQSVEGLKGFINNDLAEPDITQEHSRNRIELITDTRNSAEDWVRLLTINCQQNWPYFWYLIRAWRDGNSEAIEAGHCDTWDELRAAQERNNVANAGVMVDSGFGSKEFSEVYRNCFAFASDYIFRNPVTKKFHNQKFPGCETFAKDGWLPCKGFPSRKRWRDPSGVVLPWRMQLNDPFKGTSNAGMYKDFIFEYAAEFFLDLLDNLRRGKSGYTWSVPKNMTTAPEQFKWEEYWRHLDGKYKDRETGEWKDRSRNWPDHLLDCEKMQVALASYLGLFAVDEPPAKPDAQSLGQQNKTKETKTK